MGKLTITRNNAKILAAVNALNVIIALTKWPDVRIYPIFGDSPLRDCTEAPITEIEVCRGNQVKIKCHVTDEMDALQVCRQILNDEKLG